MYLHWNILSGNTTAFYVVIVMYTHLAFTVHTYHVVSKLLNLNAGHVFNTHHV